MTYHGAAGRVCHRAFDKRTLLMRPLSRHILVLVLFLAALTGCDTAVHEEAEPPELIPVHAFTAQTELFRRGQSGGRTIGPHFMAAVMRAWPMSMTLDARLHLPATLTRAALNDEPSVDGGEWVWTSTVSIKGQPVVYILTARPMGDQVDWTMAITSPGQDRMSSGQAEPTTAMQATPTSEAAWDSASTSAASEAAAFDTTSNPAMPSLPADSAMADSTTQGSTTQGSTTALQPSTAQSDPEPILPDFSQDASFSDSTFVLYTAQTDRDGDEGSWRLYDTMGGDRVNVLNADFKIEKATKKDITFAVPPGLTEHGGDSVVYAHDGEQHRLRWVRAEEGQTHRIRWNARSHDGSITATNYNSGQAACWGKHLGDVSCSSK